MQINEGYLVITDMYGQPQKYWHVLNAVKKKINNRSKRMWLEGF